VLCCAVRCCAALRLVLATLPSTGCLSQCTCLPPAPTTHSPVLDPIQPNPLHTRNHHQFYITLSDAAPSLDERKTIFGAVGEGLEVLEAINDAFVDDQGRPFQNIRCGLMG